MKTWLVQADSGYSWFSLFKGIEIFTQLGILIKDEKGNFSYKAPEGKLDLETSAIYQALNNRG